MSAFILRLYYVTVNTPLVIVDDLDLVRITCANYETYAKLIVNPNVPLTGAFSLEFLQPVTGRHTQESEFGVLSRCVFERSNSGGFFSGSQAPVKTMLASLRLSPGTQEHALQRLLDRHRKNHVFVSGHLQVCGDCIPRQGPRAYRATNDAVVREYLDIMAQANVAGLDEGPRDGFAYGENQY